jgi:hypothetical protein
MQMQDVLAIAVSFSAGRTPQLLQYCTVPSTFQGESWVVTSSTPDHLIADFDSRFPESEAALG